MKNMLRVAILAIVLLPFSAEALTFANIRFLQGLYGSPDPVSQTGLSQWHSNGTVITTDATRHQDGLFVKIENEAPFNELEIPGVLKPFAVVGKWKSKGHRTWVLRELGAIARWDGEKEIVISQEPPQP